MTTHLKRIGVDALIITAVVLSGALAFRGIAYAGSLTPAASPVATMDSLSDAYNALVGTSFSSSAITASSTGSAIQIARCINTNLTGGSC